MYRNLNHLVTFAALAEAGSFAGAARRLGLPASTVSEHIAALERNLGVQLVIRTTRKNRLSEIGRRMATSAARMVDAAEDAVAQAEVAKSAPQGTLRISLPFTFASEIIGPAVGRFAALFPGIKLEFKVSNEVEDLIEGGFDLAIRIGPLKESSLTRRSLGYEPQDFVSTPSYLDAAGRPSSLSDLSDHRIVGLRPRQTWTVTGPAGPQDAVLTSYISSNDPKTATAIILGGGGIGVLPRFLSEPALSDGRLEVVLPEYRPPSADMSVVYYGPATANPLTDLFTRFLQNEMRGRRR